MSNDLYPKVYLYKRIVQAKLFIDSRYAEEIELDEIADAACFSMFHFLRLFKKAYGRTPHQYLVFVRMEKAKILLKEGKAIANTCYSVGFTSVSSFSVLFKRMTGCTPADYQARQLRKQAELGTVPVKYIPGCFAKANGW